MSSGRYNSTLNLPTSKEELYEYFEMIDELLWSDVEVEDAEALRKARMALWTLEEFFAIEPGGQPKHAYIVWVSDVKHGRTKME